MIIYRGWVAARAGVTWTPGRGERARVPTPGRCQSLSFSNLTRIGLESDRSNDNPRERGLPWQVFTT